MWRRLIGQTDRGGAELGRRGVLRTWQREVKQDKAAPFCNLKVNLVTTGNFGVSVSCVCWNNGIANRSSVGVQVCLVCECCCPDPSPSQGGLAAGVLVSGNSLWVDALCSQNLSLQAAGQKVLLITLGSAAVLCFPWTGLGLKQGGCPACHRGHESGTVNGPLAHVLCLWKSFNTKRDKSKGTKQKPLKNSQR